MELPNLTFANCTKTYDQVNTLYGTWKEPYKLIALKFEPVLLHGKSVHKYAGASVYGLMETNLLPNLMSTDVMLVA